MNCKPGDLAIQVRSYAGNEGRVMTCIRLATRDEISKFGFSILLGAVWLTDQLLVTNHGTQTPLSADSLLRPIRDTPGEDETLQWLDVPTTEKANA